MKTMRLVPLHGRDDPEREMDDMGYSGPIITGIKAIHVTYMMEINIYFGDQTAAVAAQKATGWDWWDENALSVRMHKDLICMDGKFYGDWELQTMDTAGNEVS